MSDKGRCKSCKHWGGEGITYRHVPTGPLYNARGQYDPPGWDRVEVNVGGFEGECNHPSVGQEDTCETRDALAFPYDGRRATIKTGPEFGCVHWEAKP